MAQRDPSGGGHPRISSFLAEHQACAGSFKVERAHEGAARLRITCQVCGQAISQSAGEIRDLAMPEPLATGGAGGAGGGRRRPTTTAATRAKRRRRRRLGAAIGIAVVLIGALALLRSGEEADPRPTPMEAAAPAQALEADPAPGAPSVPGGGEGEPSSAAVMLERRFFLDLFAIGVPKGWSFATVGTEVELVSAGDLGRIAIFHEAGERSPKQLAIAAARFLLAEHPGASIGRPEYLRIGGRRAARVSAGYSGGEETAVMLSGSGYTFVILTRLEGASSPALAAAADAAIESFKPT